MVMKVRKADMRERKCCGEQQKLYTHGIHLSCNLDSDLNFGSSLVIEEIPLATPYAILTFS